MARVKTTLSIDENLMREVRVAAARTRRTQSEIVEEALRRANPFEAIRRKANLDEKEAEELAVTALHEMRGRRRAQTE